jgi:hypothetical protein
MKHCSRLQSKGAPALLMRKVKQSFFNRPRRKARARAGGACEMRANMAFWVNPSDLLRENK